MQAGVIYADQQNTGVEMLRKSAVQGIFKADIWGKATAKPRLSATAKGSVRRLSDGSGERNIRLVSGLVLNLNLNLPRRWFRHQHPDFA